MTLLSPSYFFSILITAVFSVLFGIMLHVILAEYDVMVSFVLWGVVFSFDFISTVITPNYKTHESNKLFHRLVQFMPSGAAFCIIGVSYLAIQIVIFLIFSDDIITHILIIATLCTILSNTHHRKNLLKYNSCNTIP